MGFFVPNALVFIAMERKGGRGGVPCLALRPVRPFRFSIYSDCAPDDGNDLQFSDEIVEIFIKPQEFELSVGKGWCQPTLPR